MNMVRKNQLPVITREHVEHGDKNQLPIIIREPVEHGVKDQRSATYF